MLMKSTTHDEQDPGRECPAKESLREDIAIVPFLD
jgi:hypothetical protein